MLPYTSQIAAFLQLPYLYYFMIANLVRLNLAIRKKLETFQEYTRGGMLC